MKATPHSQPPENAREDAAEASCQTPPTSGGSQRKRSAGAPPGTDQRSSGLTSKRLRRASSGSPAAAREQRQPNAAAAGAAADALRDAGDAEAVGGSGQRADSHPAAADVQEPVRTAEKAAAKHEHPSSPPSRSAQGASTPAAGEAEAEEAADAAEQAQGAAAAMPDWCDRPLMPGVPEDGELDYFFYLPGHPLLALACEGKAALLAKVLDNGARVDERDSRGYTAMHMACQHAQLACLRVLLEAGASQVQDRDGQTPADIAAAAGHDDVLAMIRRHEEVQAALAERQAEAEGRKDAGQ